MAAPKLLPAMSAINNASATDENGVRLAYHFKHAYVLHYHICTVLSSEITFLPPKPPSSWLSFSEYTLVPISFLVCLHESPILSS
jgi:hypothetical protein